jgi:hypothetical protein
LLSPWTELQVAITTPSSQEATFHDRLDEELSVHMGIHGTTLLVIRPKGHAGLQTGESHLKALAVSRYTRLTLAMAAEIDGD